VALALLALLAAELLLRTAGSRAGAPEPSAPSPGGEPTA
jgi:hypothetical protein